ncbi:MAG: type III-B CRISPR module RAMP protein Cmr6, partial [Bacteroidota bacterium]|nr:type III-B CRISPR module RAMP protein Cmr6 [Bacteroidota bacterium]
YTNSPNIGWLFYKEYYKDIDFLFLANKLSASEKDKIKKIKKNNERKFATLNNAIYSQKLPVNNEAEIPSSDTIEFKTSYPGFITGSGYMHGTGHDNEFKIGFYFDHTTGLPTLPGSSVKGVLRSAFKQEKGDKQDKVDYILFLLNELNIEIPSKSKIEDIEKEVFDGIKKTNKKDEDGKNIYEVLSIYERDIFHDTVFIGNDEKFLASDYITLHDKPLKNPKPLLFLKILPEISVKFQFDLKDGILSKENKLKLFKAIISDMGIGAKTNVGYGSLNDVV